MITVRVMCDTGNWWDTGINTDLNNARRYFMGQTFVRELDDGTEIRDTVVRVEQLADEAKS